MDASRQIDKHISELGDWRGEMTAKLRKIIHEADPEIFEEWKWGSPIFSCNGMICSIGSFKDRIKLHFFKGARLSDKHKLFNAGLDAKTMRAIDLNEKDTIDETKLKDLIKEAMLFNNKK